MIKNFCSISHLKFITVIYLMYIPTIFCSSWVRKPQIYFNRKDSVQETLEPMFAK